MTTPEDDTSISTSVYFSDGNIVLHIVEGEEKKMRYRLHKSVLELHSYYFSDLFDRPQTDTAELVDGCPVISLTGDKLADWDIILNALYDPFFSGTQPVSTIIAMLRIGKKYKFPDFLSDAKLRLRKQYPSTLKGFRSRPTDPRTGSIILYDSLELLAVVEENILPDDILPVLYFDHFGVLVDLDNSNNEDNEDIPGKEANNVKMISAQTQLRMLVGHRRLLLAQAKHTFAWLQEDISCNCANGSACHASLIMFEQSLATPASSGNITLRPFATFSSLKGSEFSICPKRKDAISSSMARGVKIIWEKLPSYFEVGSQWDDLIDYEDSENDGDSDREDSSDEDDYSEP